MAVADAKMPEDQRKAFLGEAQKLHDQADELAKATAARNAQGMEAILRSIKTTCTGCHEQFGALTGPIRFGRGE